MATTTDTLEQRIAEWRTYLCRRQAIHACDVDELEDHLRDQIGALGENLVLLVNLGGSVLLFTRFLAGRGSFARIERWLTAYLPVYAVWAWIVVVLFPILIGFA